MSEAEACGMNIGASAKAIEKIHTEPSQSTSAVPMYQIENKMKTSDIPGQAPTVSLTSEAVSRILFPVQCKDCSVSGD
jgi:hypothetical protein